MQINCVYSVITWETQNLFIYIKGEVFNFSFKRRRLHFYSSTNGNCVTYSCIFLLRSLWRGEKRENWNLYMWSSLMIMLSTLEGSIVAQQKWHWLARGSQPSTAFHKHTIFHFVYFLMPVQVLLLLLLLFISIIFLLLIFWEAAAGFKLNDKISGKKRRNTLTACLHSQEQILKCLLLAHWEPGTQSQLQRSSHVAVLLQ